MSSGNLTTSIRALTVDDLEAVLLIEQVAHITPWSENTFMSCLGAQYSNLALVADNELRGYAIISAAAGSAHLLNICIDPVWQKQGYGQQLLVAAEQLATQKSCDEILLEVRRGNTAALHLYEQAGYNQIGVRNGYYGTAEGGREDALVFAKTLMFAFG